MRCEDCDGVGYVTDVSDMDNLICPKCNGSGRGNEGREQPVRLFDDNHKLRMRLIEVSHKLIEANTQIMQLRDEVHSLRSQLSHARGEWI